MDRMDGLLGNIGDRFRGGNFQGIFPEVGFTCNGSIQSWVFGGQWVGRQDGQFTEFQIWRPTGDDGVYTKVGYTTINIVYNSSELYEYLLSSPLDFQAGDVFGYYQPDPPQSQWRVLFERDGRNPQIGHYYSGLTSHASQLDIRVRPEFNRLQILVNVVTGKHWVRSGDKAIPMWLFRDDILYQILQVVGVAS